MLYNLEDLRFLEENKNKMFLIFGYGRLKSNNLLNSMLLDKPEIINIGERITKEKYIMYDLGEYPLISDLGEGDYKVRGELFQVNPETLLSLDKSLSTFERKEIILEDNTVAYTYMLTIRLNSKKVKHDIDNLYTWRCSI
jgi:gamma-glutamylcyclotransferase (GGCT)/AIG2-like uncharacterized protein YtfP